MNSAAKTLSKNFSSEILRRYDLAVAGLKFSLKRRLLQCRFDRLAQPLAVHA